MQTNDQQQRKIDTSLAVYERCHRLDVLSTWIYREPLMGMPLTEIVELAIRGASPTEKIIQRSSMMLRATNEVCRASRFCINREVNDLKLPDIDLLGHQDAADLSRTRASKGRLKPGPRLRKQDDLHSVSPSAESS